MNSLGQHAQRNSAEPADGRAKDPARSDRSGMPPRRTWLTFLLILVVNYLLVRFLFPSPDAPIPVPYTFFKEQVAKANVEAIYGRGEIIEGRFLTPVTYPPPDEQNATPSRQAPTAKDRGAPFRGEPKTVHNFTTTLPSFVDPGLEKFLIDHNVEISAKPIQQGGSPLTTFLFGFGPAMLIIVFYVWMFRRAAQQGGGLGGGLMGIGKSKARRYDQDAGHEGHVRRCRRHRRSRERAGRDRRFPQGAREVHAPGRHRSQGRAAGRRAGHGQDLLARGGGGRSRRAVLLDERRRVRGDDRRRRRGARARSVQAGARATHRRSSSSTSSTRSAARAGRWRSAARASRSRR